MSCQSVQVSIQTTRIVLCATCHRKTRNDPTGKSDPLVLRRIEILWITATASSASIAMVVQSRPITNAMHRHQPQGHLSRSSISTSFHNIGQFLFLFVRRHNSTIIFVTRNALAGWKCGQCTQVCVLSILKLLWSAFGALSYPTRPL